MKCVSSCFSCLCGTRNSSRISPSEPIQVIQSSQDKYRIQDGDESYRVGAQNGSINPNFSIDDGDNDDHPSNTNPRGSESVTDSNCSSTFKVKSLYIEVGKERLVRVMHVPSKEQSETSPGKNSINKNSLGKDGDDNGDDSGSSSETSPVNEKKDGDADPGGEEDEEEYWFTKWARKPRFRSIFAKNPDQRPKLNNENNNNSEENKISVEAEMARAAAAAKRRAWAYNNNGNCGEPTITQQPTINPNDEEEFNSIAIVNSNKQQWSKGSSNSNNSAEGSSNEETPPPPYNSPSNSNNSHKSPTLQVQVSVERQSNRDMSESMMEGVSNPAFQDDDEDEQVEKQDSPVREEKVSEDKTEESEQSTLKLVLDSSSSSTTSRASIKGTSQEEDADAIISEPVGEDCNTTLGASSVGSLSLQKGLPGESVLNYTPKKPLIFFIHSISCSSDVWLKQMEFFQQLGYEVVAPDLLGHGLSSTPLNPKYYFFESLVQDMILIFDHFAKDDVKVVVIGHGYGACLAAMLTRVRLKNIALLITIAGGGPTPLVRRTCCQDSWFSWKCKLFHSNRIRGRFDNPELKHVLPPAIYKNVLSGQVWADGDSAFYRRVTVPTLLVYGMRDKVVTLVEECEMERTIPKSFLELIDTAGHMVMLDEPEKLNKMLCKFIQSWS